jgi:hypothetical protein
MAHRATPPPSTAERDPYPLDIEEMSRDVDPHTAMESLRSALDDAGIVFPSLGVDHVSPDLRLVELGRVRADVAERLTQALRREGRSNGSSTSG